MQHRLRAGPYYRDRLRYDRQLEIELSICSEYGIPHSEFLGWSPVDQAKAVAIMAHKSERCSLCGTADWEWDPAQGGTRFAYEPVEKLCQGCYVKHEQGSGQPGTSVVLEPTNTAASARRQLAAAAAHRAHQRQIVEQRRAAAELDSSRPMVVDTGGVQVIPRER